MAISLNFFKSGAVKRYTNSQKGNLSRRGIFPRKSPIALSPATGHSANLVPLRPAHIGLGPPPPIDFLSPPVRMFHFDSLRSSAVVDCTRMSCQIHFYFRELTLILFCSM